MPNIVDDDICDLCDDDALPYDAEWDYPFCARHAMVMATGHELENFLNEITDKYYWTQKQVHSGEFEDTQTCSQGLFCEAFSTPRINKRWYKHNHAVVELCTHHAAGEYMGGSYCLQPLLDEWLFDLGELF